ncbi:sugar transferase [Flavobacterium psychrotrophum]|uniref:sugar transferase n=1 Tax=Flavobacterium psychrotrophum TaxID=2294119 RepID=UPI0019693F26|nr:sugar transferase [Flavobacterium psychrotrophum]
MVKRLFDVFLSLAGLLAIWWLIFLFYVLVTLSDGQNGMFTQLRVGRYGKKFTIYKLRSMKDSAAGKVVTPVGRFMRRYKIDELPQLFNILIGTMSFVGPRPDVPGYYDTLRGDDRKLLLMRPGLTGPASLKYSNEEALLADTKDPVYLNDYVIFPDKVKINRKYQDKSNLWTDIKLIFYTIFRGKNLSRFWAD